MDDSDKGSRTDSPRRGERSERSEREPGQYSSRREMNTSGSMHGGDRPRAGAMEVLVDTNVEKAMKILKRKLIKEGLFKELKSRRYYEKPSDKKKRKMKESIKKARKDEARTRKNNLI